MLLPGRTSRRQPRPHAQPDLPAQRRMAGEADRGRDVAAGTAHRTGTARHPRRATGPPRRRPRTGTAAAGSGDRHPAGPRPPRHLGKFIPGWHTWPDVERTAAAVLADIAAKRRILARHRTLADEGGHPTACVGCGGIGVEGDWRTENINDCPELRDLASAYSDRPGYRQEWAP